MNDTEKEIRRKIRNYLKNHVKNGKFFSYNPFYGEAGIPDIIGCIDSKFIGLEVKSLKGTLSKLQAQKIIELKFAGGLICVVKSVEDVKYFLKANFLI